MYDCQLIGEHGVCELTHFFFHCFSGDKMDLVLNFAGFPQTIFFFQKQNVIDFINSMYYLDFSQYMFIFYRHGHLYSESH